MKKAIIALVTVAALSLAYVYCCPPDCCKANTECKISEKK